MRVAALIDAALNRRVLVRVWLHSVALLVTSAVAIAVVVHTSFEHFVRPSLDTIALTLARHAVELRDDPPALIAELRTLHERAHVDMSVYRADGLLVATSREPPFAPLQEEERKRLSRSGAIAPSDKDCPNGFLAGAFAGDRLVAYAIMSRPMPPFPWAMPFIILTAVITLLVLVSIPLARSIASPLENLGRLARDLGAGNLNVRAPEDRRDEIGDLARSFNEMAQRLQRLRSAERELLANVSHEIRTPLARMRVVLELAATGDVDKMRRCLAEIATDVAELDQMLADIFTATRLEVDDGPWREAHPPLRRRVLDIETVAGEAIARFRERSPKRLLEYNPSSERLPVDGDPILLRRALENLLDNAHKYSGENEAIRVGLGRTDLRGSPAIRVEVVDQGIGIADEDLPRIFTSFFRADRSRTRATGGVGLGLSLTRRIVEAHGGVVGVASELNHGSSFWVVLPLVNEGSASPDPTFPRTR